jgi:hypothetical protein
MPVSALLHLTHNLKSHILPAFWNRDGSNWTLSHDALGTGFEDNL